MSFGPPWTDREKDLLHFYWGILSLERLASKVGRSPSAVREKARTMGLGPMRRGKISLVEFARRTGYDRGRILIAAQRLGMRLPRVPQGRRPRAHGRVAKGRHYALDEEHVEAILGELAKHPDGARLATSRTGEWGGKGRRGYKPPACLDCGTRERPHYARGRCRRCYDRRRARGESM